MIQYFSRYSDTDLPDNMGRWARIGVYNNIRVCWISRIENAGRVVFSASCHFPTKNNDTATEHKLFDSFEEAKEFVSERWNWFLSNVCKTCL